MNQKLSPIDEAKLNRHNMAPRTSYFQDELNALRKENAELKEKLTAIQKAAETSEKAQNFLAALEAWFIC